MGKRALIRHVVLPEWLLELVTFIWVNHIFTICLYMKKLDSMVTLDGLSIFGHGRLFICCLAMTFCFMEGKNNFTENLQVS